MVDAESKTKTGRVRHCYPRDEVYHRFIHSNTLVYHSRHNPVYAIHDWIFVGNRYNYSFIAKQTKEEFYNIYKGQTNSLIAAINRDKKRILISTVYSKHYWDLSRAVPDDWEIFYTNKHITSFDVINNDEELYKTHITYLLERFTYCYLINMYKIILGKSRIIHTDVNTYIKDNYMYNEIKNFISKYKLTKYDWSKVSLNPKYEVIYNPKTWKKDILPIPTVRKVYSGKLFTNKEVLLLSKCYFYTQFCYNEGIPFKDVDKYYNVEISTEEFDEYANKHSQIRSVDANFELFKDAKTWNDYIKTSVDFNRNIRQKYIEDNIAKSEENRKEAQKKAEELCDLSINDWREGKTVNCTNIEYRSYTRPRRRNDIGSWHTSYIYTRFQFKNTQLKLTGNRIVTSRGAAVSLKEGILMFKLFLKLKDKYPIKNKITKTEFGNVKVGIYDLRSIEYKDKITDGFTKLGYKTWCIQIGCHSLWLDDIFNFIEYYHLEKEFTL